MNEDGSIVIGVDMNVAQAEKDLAKIKEKIFKTEAEIANITKKREEALAKSTSLQPQLDAENKKLYELKQQLKELQAITKDSSASRGERDRAKGLIPDLREQIQEQSQYVRALTTEYNQVEKSIDRYQEQLRGATDNLISQKTQAEELTVAINEAADGSGNLKNITGQVEKGFEKLNKRLSGLIKRVFVFSLFTSALRSMRDWMGKVVKSNAEASAALAKLKAALLTMVQPLVNIVIPAFTALVNALTKVVAAIAQLFAMLTGTTIDNSKAAAEALNDEANALGGVGSAAKKAEKSLASFDEINQLSTGSDAGGGGAGSNQPDFSFDIIQSESALKKILDLVLLIGSALAAWKIGNALGMNLQQILGLMLAIYSAVHLVYALWDAWVHGLDGSNLLEILLSALGLVTGLYIAFGKTGAAIGLIVSGIAMLVTAFKDAYTNGWNVYNLLLAIAGIMATGAGISILTGSFIPLLIAGISSILLAITVLSGHGEELLEGLKMAFGGLVDFVVGIFTLDFERAISGLQAVFSGLFVAVDAILQGLRDILLSFLDWIDDKTNGVLRPLIELIKTDINMAYEVISGIFSMLFNLISDVLTDVITFIVSVFTMDWDNAWQAVKQLFIDIWNDLFEGFTNIFSSIYDAAVEWINKITGGITDAWNKVKSFFDWGKEGKETGEYLSEGLAKGWQSGQKDVEKGAANILKGINNEMGVNSPSKETYATGKYMIIGMANAITQLGPQVVTAFVNILYQLQTNADTTIEAIRGYFVSFLDYLIRTWITQWKNTWATAEKESTKSMRAVESEINRLNASLASIERDVTITITTIYITKGDPSDFQSAGGMDRTRTIAAAEGTPIMPVPTGNTTASTYAVARAAIPAIALSDVPSIARGMSLPQNASFTRAVYAGSNNDYDIGKLFTLISQAIQEGFDNAHADSDNGEREAKFYVGNEEFGRLVYDAYTREKRRRGASLVKEW